MEEPGVSHAKVHKGGGLESWVGLITREQQSIANDHVSRAERAGTQLDGGMGAPRTGDAPRPQPADDPGHRSRAIDKDDVDGETHEGGVHGEARLQQQSAGRRQPIASQQTLAPRRAGDGERDCGGQDLPGSRVNQRRAHRQNTPGTRCHATRRQYAW